MLDDLNRRGTQRFSWLDRFSLQASLNPSRFADIPAPLALRAAKIAITAAPHLPLDQGLAFERQVYGGLLETQDRSEGLKAFAEKRRAVFTGQ